MGHRVEPVAEDVGQLGLPAGQRLADRFDAAGGLGSAPQHFAEPPLELAGALGLDLRQRKPRAAVCRVLR